MQHEDVFDNDFVHDDTQHPDEAIKINIQESENRLHGARKDYDAAKAELDKAKALQTEADAVHAKRAEELEAAGKKVAEFNETLAGLPAFQKALEAADTKVVEYKQTANETDADATAAAATVKQAQEDLHKQIMNLVDAKENVSIAETNVSHWEKKITEAQTANVSLAEWQQKLNVTAQKEAALRKKLATVDKSLSAVHKDWKVKEARYAEAKKLFESDKAKYEELVGPYPKPEPNDENLWVDALFDGTWHENWNR